VSRQDIPDELVDHILSRQAECFDALSTTLDALSADPNLPQWAEASAVVGAAGSLFATVAARMIRKEHLIDVLSRVYHEIAVYQDDTRPLH
jgi:hypothetical protein